MEDIVKNTEDIIKKIENIIKNMKNIIKNMEDIIKNMEEALSEFSIRDLQMNGRCRHSLTADAQERVYSLLKNIINTKELKEHDKEVGTTFSNNEK